MMEHGDDEGEKDRERERAREISEYKLYNNL